MVKLNIFIPRVAAAYIYMTTHCRSLQKLTIQLTKNCTKYLSVVSIVHNTLLGTFCSTYRF